MFYTGVLSVISTHKEVLIRCLNNTFKMYALCGVMPADFLKYGVRVIISYNWIVASWSSLHRAVCCHGLNKNCVFWQGGTLKDVSFYSQFVPKVTTVEVTVLPSPCSGFLERRAAGLLNKCAPVFLSALRCVVQDEHIPRAYMSYFDLQCLEVGSVCRKATSRPPSRLGWLYGYSLIRLCWLNSTCAVRGYNSTLNPSSFE